MAGDAARHPTVVGRSNRGPKTASGDGHKPPSGSRTKGATNEAASGDDRPGAVQVETNEARLESKAAASDEKTFAGRSLGQMTRQERHKLLFG